MKLEIIYCAAPLPSWAQEACDEYSKKISYFYNISAVRVPNTSAGREAAEKKKAAEGTSILERAGSDAFIVLCDETGHNLDSIKFAKKFENLLNMGKKKICFIIAGPYGASEDLKKRANLTVSLAPFTLNHHIALTVLLEQIYRATTIAKGIQYHNA